LLTGSQELATHRGNIGSNAGNFLNHYHGHGVAASKNPMAMDATPAANQLPHGNDLSDFPTSDPFFLATVEYQSNRNTRQLQANPFFATPIQVTPQPNLFGQNKSNDTTSFYQANHDELFYSRT